MLRDKAFMKPLIVFAILAALAVPADAQQQRSGIYQQGEFIDVWNHRGGNVLQMVQTREQLAATGRVVRIRGYCRSACTILTTLPNACFAPKARIGFHAPRIQGTQIIAPYVDQIMGSFYRGGIRERWFGGWNRSREMQIISAREYTQLDPQARFCPSLG